MPHSASLKKSPSLDKWISIAEDGRVLIRTGKVDIGQRISTALALIAAEELDVDISRIDVAIGIQVNIDSIIDSSTTIE